MKTQIIELYKAGIPMKKISNILGISSATVWYILRDSDLEIRRKHSLIDETYFDNPNIEKAAYWAGFIAADGYINNTKSSINSQSKVVIELSLKDKSHLQMLGDDIGKNVTDYERHNSCKLSLTSNKICKQLLEYNITQNKSLTLQFPTNINTDNIHHFIRGYFDGDGCFYKIYEIIGTQHFLQDLINVLPFDAEYSFYKPKDENSYVLRLKTKSFISFFKFMYKDATIYLDRKYQKQLAFYNKRFSLK